MPADSVAASLADRDQVVQRDVPQVHAVLDRPAQDLQRTAPRVLGRRDAALVRLGDLCFHRDRIQPLGRIGEAGVALHDAERSRHRDAPVRARMAAPHSDMLFSRAVKSAIGSASGSGIPLTMVKPARCTA